MALVWGKEAGSLQGTGKELSWCLSLNHKPGGWISSLHKELLTATPGIKPVNNPSLLSGAWETSRAKRASAERTECRRSGRVPTCSSWKPRYHVGVALKTL